MNLRDWEKCTPTEHHGCVTQQKRSRKQLLDRSVPADANKEEISSSRTNHDRAEAWIIREIEKLYSAV